MTAKAVMRRFTYYQLEMNDNSMVTFQVDSGAVIYVPRSYITAKMKQITLQLTSKVLHQVIIRQQVKEKELEPEKRSDWESPLSSYTKVMVVFGCVLISK